MARKAISTEDKTEMPRRKTKAKATKRKAASSYREKAPVRRDLETEKFPADYEDALYTYVNAYLDSIKDDTARYTKKAAAFADNQERRSTVCLLYTSPSQRDRQKSRKQYYSRKKK